ncbi:unnamed protein product [Orchesella dallaii]|uniref:Uncharacterized protein n=1 Tax=Orchesella dallaii TaxID=48710 RepID=A0ABP1RYD4_9HEXA
MVTPLKFPVALSRRRFKQIAENRNSNNGNKTRGSKQYKQENESSFQFLTTPSPKQTFFVQVFVHPMFRQTDQKAFDKIFYLFDSSFFSQILDYRVGYRVPGRYKCCTFYIHVEPLLFAHQEVKGRKRFPTHYIETIKIMGNNEDHRIHYFNPTKLFFWIEYLQERQLFLVKEEAVITCLDTDTVFYCLHEHADDGSRRYAFLYSVTMFLERNFGDLPLWAAEDLTFSEMFLRQQIQKTKNSAKEHLKRLVKPPMNLLESVAMTPFSFYVKQISKCGRDVFVDKFSRVNKLHYELINLPAVQYENIATSKTPYGRFYQFLGNHPFRIPSWVF